MTPDIDMQLRVVIKALQDVVTPALPKGNPMAAEQLRLSIATLQLVQNRHTWVLARVRRELLDAVGLAEQVLLHVPDAVLGAMLEEARQVLQMGPLEQAIMDEPRLRLMERIGALARDLSENEARKAVFALLLDHAGRQFDLSRAWLVQSGRELDPAALPRLEDLLARAEKTPPTV